MNEQDHSESDESGILQLGSSAAFSDELRRSTAAETEEIAKVSGQLSNGINLEEKLRCQAEKDRSHATKEMESLLSSEKEAIDRITMDGSVMRGLVNTLKAELLTYGTEMEEDKETQPFGSVKRFNESTMARVNELRIMIEEIQRTLLCQAEDISSLRAEAENVESSIAVDGLEDSLNKSIASTSSKLTILEDIKKRKEYLSSTSEAAETRLREVEKEISAMVCTNTFSPAVSSSMIIGT